MKLFSGLKYLKYNEKIYYQVEWCKKIHMPTSLDWYLAVFLTRINMIAWIYI
jgi:hypothetical protein